MVDFFSYFQADRTDSGNSVPGIFGMADLAFEMAGSERPAGIAGLPVAGFA